MTEISEAQRACVKQLPALTIGYEGDNQVRSSAG